LLRLVEVDLEYDLFLLVGVFFEVCVFLVEGEADLEGDLALSERERVETIFAARRRIYKDDSFLKTVIVDMSIRNAARNFKMQFQNRISSTRLGFF